MTTPLIEMRHISKAFPGVQALKDVSLAVYGGEVHMLVGQNGAGKSTLIKILCGAYRPDQGEFLLNGKPVHIESTRDARRLGDCRHLSGVLSRSLPRHCAEHLSGQRVSRAHSRERSTGPLAC